MNNQAEPHCYQFNGNHFMQDSVNSESIYSSIPNYTDPKINYNQPFLFDNKPNYSFSNLAQTCSANSQLLDSLNAQHSSSLYIETKQANKTDTGQSGNKNDLKQQNAFHKRDPTSEPKLNLNLSYSYANSTNSSSSSSNSTSSSPNLSQLSPGSSLLINSDTKTLTNLDKNKSSDKNNNYASNTENQLNTNSTCSYLNANANSNGMNGKIDPIAEYDQELAESIEHELGLKKQNGPRKNSWGNLSYAELITRAIESSSEKRLTLSQIYDWIIKYVPYFKEKFDRTSSAGWKNSIRHNLSLHNRFIRVQNESSGKSSWWMINPEAEDLMMNDHQILDYAPTLCQNAKNPNVGLMLDCGRRELDDRTLPQPKKCRRSNAASTDHANSKFDLSNNNNNSNNIISNSNQTKLSSDLNLSLINSSEINTLNNHSPKSKSLKQKSKKSKTKEAISTVNKLDENNNQIVNNQPFILKNSNQNSSTSSTSVLDSPISLSNASTTSISPPNFSYGAHVHPYSSSSSSSFNTLSSYSTNPYNEYSSSYNPNTDYQSTDYMALQMSSNNNNNNNNSNTQTFHNYQAQTPYLMNSTAITYYNNHSNSMSDTSAKAKSNFNNKAYTNNSHLKSSYIYTQPAYIPPQSLSQSSNFIMNSQNQKSHSVAQNNSTLSYDLNNSNRLTTTAAAAAAPAAASSALSNSSNSLPSTPTSLNSCASSNSAINSAQAFGEDLSLTELLNNNHQNSASNNLSIGSCLSNSKSFVYSNQESSMASSSRAQSVACFYS